MFCFRHNKGFHHPILDSLKSSFRYMTQIHILFELQLMFVKTLVLGKLCRVAITIYKHYYKNLNHAVEGPKKLVNVTEQWSASIYWPCGDWVICRIFVMSPFAIEMASMAFGSDFLPSHTYQVYKIKVVQFNWSTWLELMLSSIRWDDQSVRAVPWTFSWQLSEETPWMFINPLNPKIWLSILPSSCYTISCT